MYTYSQDILLQSTATCVVVFRRWHCIPEKATWIMMYEEKFFENPKINKK